MWKLAGIDIPAPHKKTVKLSIQSSQHRTLSGRFTRDYIGTENKVIECEWDHIAKADFDHIATIRQAQIEYGVNPELRINKDGFDFVGNVIIEMPEINFHIPNHYRYRNIKITFYEIGT